MNFTSVSERTLTHEQESKFGTKLTSKGVRFRLWAPEARAVSLKIFEPPRILPMQKLGRGWFEVEAEGAQTADRYKFVLEGGLEVPDPASRFQPEGVHGPSAVINPRDYRWTDAGWRGRPWEETVLYEMHVGTFTEEGTYRAAMTRLDHLQQLGVTAVELMPLAEFSGRRNWGYDGALLFAPHAGYGSPDDLKAFIDGAHRLGISVFLDVVYNHFGPKGNDLSSYAPVLTEGHQTPWGAAVNYDSDGSQIIRDFIKANARYWLNEYRFDGLRFDAVHEIKDDGPRHVLQEVAEQVRGATDGRHVHLILENADNRAGWLTRDPRAVPEFYTAQWADDVHHGLHVALTGERHWYYADFAGRPELLGRALSEGFAFQGEVMESESRARGEPSAHLPPTAFVSFIQNHDQIGNRPFGERLCHLVPTEASQAAASVVLLSPQIPLLFMGEEWGASSPFAFFSDVGNDLASRIREGRHAELKHSPEGTPEGIPDPMAASTFISSKLRWQELDRDEHAEMLRLYRQLIAIRSREIVPRLFGIEGNSAEWRVLSEGAVDVRWKLGDGSTLRMIANLSPEPLSGVDLWTSDTLWLQGSAAGDTLAPWSVLFRLGSKTLKGSTTSALSLNIAAGL